MGKKKKGSKQTNVDDLDKEFFQLRNEAPAKKSDSLPIHLTTPASLPQQQEQTGGENKVENGVENGESRSVSEKLEQEERSAPEISSKKEEDSTPQDGFEVKIKDGRCQHLKSIGTKPQKIREKIGHIKDWSHCQGCLDAENKAKKKVERLDVTMTGLSISETESTVKPLPAESLWMCLSCCKINCGRMVNMHALGHSNEMKGNHPIAINLETMECWCYHCDAHILPSKNKNQLVRDYQNALGNYLQTHQSKKKSITVSSKKSKVSIDTKSSKKSEVIISANIPKVKVFSAGLQNLGNTCFFNSVIQVLAETSSLKCILSGNDINTANCSNSLAARTDVGLGPLATSFKALLNKMWKQQGGTIAPKELFTQIGKKWKVFRGFRQQDSQELMRYLFDGIKQEELDMIKRQLSEEAGTSAEPQMSEPPENHTCPKKLAADEIEESSKYMPFIDACFSGKLVSVIVCDTCKKISYAPEDFFDLSLPVRKPAKGGELNSKVRLLAQPKKEEAISEKQDGDEKDSLPITEKPTEAHMRHVEKLLRSIGESDSDDLTILRSLNQFTGVDCLDGDNKFACENCYKLIHGSDEKADEETPMAKVEDNNIEKLEDGSAPNGTLNGDHNIIVEGSTDTEINIEKGSDDNIDNQSQDLRKEKETETDEKEEETDEREKETDEKEKETDGEKSVSNDENGDGNDSDDDEAENTDSLGNTVPKSVIKLKDEDKAEAATKKAAYIFRKGYKRYLISKLPPTLVLHLKRFEQSGRFGLMRKIEDHVDIPTELDMSPYFVPKSEIEDESDGNDQEAPEKHHQDDSMSKKYRLYGAVVHMGTLGGGHYINYVLSSKVGPAESTKSNGSAKPDKKSKSANTTKNIESTELEQPGESKECATEEGACKDEITGQSQSDKDGVEKGDAKIDTRQWISCSDSHVRSSSLEEVLASRAYLLFYERY